MHKSELTPRDAAEIDYLAMWLDEDQNVKRVAQMLVLMSEEDMARTLDWVKYLSGDASELSGPPPSP